MPRPKGGRDTSIPIIFGTCSRIVWLRSPKFGMVTRGEKHVLLGSGTISIPGEYGSSGRSKSNGMWAGPENFGDAGVPPCLGTGHGWSLEMRRSPARVSLSMCLFQSVQTYERNYGDSPKKNWPLASRLSRILFWHIPHAPTRYDT